MIYEHTSLPLPQDGVAEDNGVVAKFDHSAQFTFGFHLQLPRQLPDLLP
jgi:hypothetical protein